MSGFVLWLRPHVQHNDISLPQPQQQFVAGDHAQVGAIADVGTDEIAQLPRVRFGCLPKCSP
jgi:hypothetical protein